MRKAGLLISIAVAATVLVGCGGGGGGSNSQRTTRTVAGFVYVKGTGGGTPQVAVLPTANPPAGYFAATGGTIRLAVADGTISRAPDQEDFLMSSSNAVVCTVEGPINSSVSVSALGTITGTDGTNNLSGTLTAFNGNLGPKANEGTVLTLNNGPATYTPGPTTAMRYTVDGVVPTEPTIDFILGDATRSLAVIGLDASGVVTTQAFTVAASTDGAVVGGSGNSFTLDAGAATATLGALTIDIDATGVNLQASIDATFGLGTVTSITLTSATGTTPLVWGTTSVPAAIANTTSLITATVRNQNNAPMPGQTVTLTTDKAPANTWTGAPGVSGSVTGTIFTATNTGNSDAAGQFVGTFNPPAAVDGPLTGADLAIKGVNIITATVGAVTNTVNVTIERPFGAFTIAGPTSMNINSSSPANFTAGYRIATASDVDNEAIVSPRLDPFQAVAVYSDANSTSLPATVGNAGDSSAPTDASLASSFAGNVLSSGSVPGRLDVTAVVNGVTSSNTVVVGVLGQPSKIVLAPNTAIAGGTYTGPATASVYAGTANTTLGLVTITLIDSGGNDVTSTVSGLVTTVSVVSGSGATLLSSPAANPFEVQAGTADGAFDVVVTGTGMSGLFNINRRIGIDLP
jgi:hypothetical protein